MTKWRVAVGSGLVVLVAVAVAWCAVATDARMYFASDKNGQNPVTNVKEGDQIFIVVDDPDENIDCDLREKIWTDVKIMDPKTGAYIVWESYSSCTLNAPDGYKGKTGCTTKGDYLEETGADTGLFVSRHAFQIGTREDFGHAVGHPQRDPCRRQRRDSRRTSSGATTSTPRCDFRRPLIADTERFGPRARPASGDNYLHTAVSASAARAPIPGIVPGTGLAVMPASARFVTIASEFLVGTSPNGGYLVGRFENMDTLIGMYQDSERHEGRGGRAAEDHRHRVEHHLGLGDLQGRPRRGDDHGDRPGREPRLQQDRVRPGFHPGEPRILESCELKHLQTSH